MTPRPVDEQLARLTRGAEHVVPPDDLRERLAEGRPLRVKLGVDPTARDITLGWAVPLRKLRDFQDEGHTAVLIIGDFTARIGDPSGKSETRPQLSVEQVQANAEACVAQLMDILSEDNLEVRYNSEWLEPLGLSDLLRLTSHYTVAQMLERDDFSKRYADNRPIALSEFMYPLMQGYDSVAIECDVELGGTDQLFNLLVGRDLQRAYGQRPQIALTMPLLVGTDGVQKMSQSLGNYIAIREEPAEIFGKTMSIPDELVEQWALLGAQMNDEQLAEVRALVEAGGPKAGEAKRKVARSVIELYRDPAAAAGAEAAFDRLFKQHNVPDDMPETPIPTAAVSGGRANLAILLVELDLASSRTEARRLLDQGGVKLDGKPVREEAAPVEALQDKVLQVGKRRFVRLAG
jgi:tyrosyl-tRNA synthetase